MTATAEPYAAYLAAKVPVAGTRGIDIRTDLLHPSAFPFQRDLTRWALRKGKAAIFAGTGLGKTLMQLDWAAHIDGRVLVLAPLGVALQTEREAARWEIDATYCRSDTGARITITNYEMLEHFDQAAFAGVVLDECFAPGTEVDTPTGQMHIEDVKMGDWILNASGADQVSDVHRRRVPYAIRITVGGKSTVSSPNHPYFTRRGWVSAQDLVPGDEVIRTAAAVRMVRGDVHDQVRPGRENALLRAVLLSEMANEPTRVQSQGSHAGGCKEARGEEASMVRVGITGRAGRAGAHPEDESDRRPGGTGEDLPRIEGDSPRTFRTWRQWARLDRAAADNAGRTWPHVDTGISLVVGSTDSQLSHALQARLSESRIANRYRGGWVLSSQPEGAGSEEGFQTRFARVDGLEVLEQGHPVMERFRDADGSFYFYDIGATRHPSFSVNGLLVHNSSILKAFDGKTRTALIGAFADTPYRLCCTATPAPNDIAEIANHAEFLGLMTRAEMLATFFVHDDEGWRLKGHAREPFYTWLASWGMMLTKPSDLGYSDDGYELPPLSVEPLFLDVELPPTDRLFRVGLSGGITERTQIRRASLGARLAAMTALVAQDREQWVIWCGLNDEQDALVAALGNECVSIDGRTPMDEKLRLHDLWLRGERRILVTKSKVFGFGMNWQHCHQMAFFGLSDSWESYYQAIRRCWRFGQLEPVKVAVVLADAEEPVYLNVMRKEREALSMQTEIVKHVAEYEREELAVARVAPEFREDVAIGVEWEMYLGDCVETLAKMEVASVDLVVTSPPFLSLYTYSASERDVGNCRTDEDFREHIGYVADALLRVVKPGRIACIHVEQVPSLLSRDGVIGLKDFRGGMIRAFQESGWVYHGEITIDKDPQAQAIRTHSKALLFAQLRKDSSWLRPALADYVLLFRKPGDNAVPIQPEINNEQWIEWARPIWYGIRESDTLQVAPARSEDDERHICPLQLGTIERCIALWSNHGERVLDPFAGIGSTPYQAVLQGRYGIGIELKREYWEVASNNLRRASVVAHTPTLFDE